MILEVYDVYVSHHEKVEFEKNIFPNLPKSGEFFFQKLALSDCIKKRPKQGTTPQ